MTDSCCWIDLRDDEGLARQLRVLPGVGIDPSRVEMGFRYLWINDLRSWAARNNVPIEYRDKGWIVEQITVDKHQLLSFLQDMLGPESTADGAGTIDIVRSMVRAHGREEGRYHILADEY